MKPRGWRSYDRNQASATKIQRILAALLVVAALLRGVNGYREWRSNDGRKDFLEAFMDDEKMNTLFRSSHRRDNYHSYNYRPRLDSLDDSSASDEELSDFWKEILKAHDNGNKKDENWRSGPSHRRDNYHSHNYRPRQDSIDDSSASDEELLDFWKEILKSYDNGKKRDRSWRSKYSKPTTDSLEDMDVETEDWDGDKMDEILAYFALESTELEIPSDWPSMRMKAARFLRTYQEELHKWRRKAGLADWAKETNITKHNTQKSKMISLEMADWGEKKRHEADKLDKEGLNFDEKRMLKFLNKSTSLNEKNLRTEEVTLKSRISDTYSKAQVCNKTTGKCQHFEPGLVNLFRKSRSYDELLWAWKGWRDAIGPKIREDWIKASKLSNKGAREHGYRDKGDFVRKLYEDPSFERNIDELWRRLKPFYLQLHAYVRSKLRDQYGDRVSLTKPIPAHLLGGMWAMKWDNILDLVQPYPQAGGFEVTKGMKEKNMTVDQMFTLADQFYQSVGLPAMTPQFWNNSMFTRPEGNRSVVCYASAHNLEGDDVRVKMCAAVTSEYLYVVHHEMGHCQYYLAYNRHQPELFQEGANAGFHEAIGDTAALSVISPTHLEKLGILKKSSMTEEQRRQKDLNFLMQKALGKLAFFPFAMTMAKWSWDVNRGVIPTAELNAAWWRYRKRYQGIMPPINRTEADFDPGCKFHIAHFVPYIRYFVSHVLQFQFLEALCDLAGYEGPLHKCDFAGSRRAGEKFAKMLQMGSSKPWPHALQALTNTTKMDANSVTKYFAPLLKWLQTENKKLGNKIGWD